MNQLDELSKDFDWWWRRPGAAMMCLYRCSSDYYYKLRMVVIPPTAKGCFVFNIKKTWLKKPRKLEHAEIEELCRKWFVGNYSEYAFWYELHARRHFANKMDRPNPLYEFGVPFPKLTSQQLHILVSRSPTRKKPRHAYTVSRLSDVENNRTINFMRDRQKNGWSSPRLISFNLKECRDGEILKRLEDLLRVERAQRGIPEPAMNQNRSNRKIYAGRSFTEIEALGCNGIGRSTVAKRKTTD